MATDFAVLLVPTPTTSCAVRSAQTLAHTSTTARRSDGSRAADSPVVPSATMPATPASRYSWQRRSTASSDTSPSDPNGVTSGTYTPRSRRSSIGPPLLVPLTVCHSLCVPLAVLGRHRAVRARVASRSRQSSRNRPRCRGGDTLRPVSEPWRTLLTLAAGLATGLLSGMFGVGGAVVSTPAIRALGATPLQ